MGCDCNNDRVVLIIKQGEQRSYNFTITDKTGNPVDLTGRVIQAEIKKYPLYKVDSLQTILLTEESSPNGFITEPTEGKFTLTILEDQSSVLPPKDYYLIITMITGEEKIIISGEGDLSGILKVCNQ